MQACTCNAARVQLTVFTERQTKHACSKTILPQSDSEPLTENGCTQRTGTGLPRARQACELNISSTLYNSRDKRAEPSAQGDDCGACRLSRCLDLDSVWVRRGFFHGTVTHELVVNSLNLQTLQKVLEMEVVCCFFFKKK